MSNPAFVAIAVARRLVPFALLLVGVGLLWWGVGLLGVLVLGVAVAWLVIVYPAARWAATMAVFGVWALITLPKRLGL